LKNFKFGAIGLLMIFVSACQTTSISSGNCVLTNGCRPLTVITLDQDNTFYRDSLKSSVLKVLEFNPTQEFDVIGVAKGDNDAALASDMAVLVIKHVKSTVNVIQELDIPAEHINSFMKLTADTKLPKIVVYLKSLMPRDGVKRITLVP
jgi:hypothetical protein